MSLLQTDTEIDGKSSQNCVQNQMHSSHNLVCLYWHILDPFIIALTIATRIAIQFTRCLQYKWYSDNHHGLPVSALCMAKESAALVGLHGLAPARAPQITNAIAMLGSTERVD